MLSQPVQGHGGPQELALPPYQRSIRWCTSEEALPQCPSPATLLWHPAPPSCPHCPGPQAAANEARGLTSITKALPRCLACSFPTRPPGAFRAQQAPPAHPGGLAWLHSSATSRVLDHSRSKEGAQAGGTGQGPLGCRAGDAGPTEGQGPSRTARPGEPRVGGPPLNLVLGAGAPHLGLRGPVTGTLSAEPGHLVAPWLPDLCALPGQTKLGKATLSPGTAVFTHRQGFMCHSQNEHHYHCTFVLNIND